jgi:pimeloyl-ACP methyl ester carboxylesterase
MTANSPVATDTTQYFPTPETIEFEGLSIRLIRGGAKKGMPIVLTSPWPESVYAFRLIWPRLAELGPLVAIDLPGFGMSDASRGALSPAGMGAFILRLFDELGIQRCHAIGPDIGTTAFLFAAAEQPERFATLTLGSGGTGMDLLGEQLRGIIEARKPRSTSVQMPRHRRNAPIAHRRSDAGGRDGGLSPLVCKRTLR